MNPTSSVSRTAWLVVALLIPVALLNYLDRQMLATMKPSMMKDLPDIATAANWGFILGSFKWVYAIFSPIGGFLADRMSRRHVICFSLFTWSLVTWATGHVHSYEQLLATRAVMGISEAFYIPAALALIADYHVGATRSRAIGLHQMGIYFGVIIGGFAGYAADSPDLGWRGAFTWCGLVGTLYALPLFIFLKNKPASAEAAPGLNPREAITSLARNREFLKLILYFTLPAMAAWIVRDWMPDILGERFHLGQGKAGVSAVLYWQVAAIAGVLIGGWIADRWTRQNPRGRIYVSAIGVLLLLPALFGVGNASSLIVALSFLVIFGFGWGFFDCNSMPILCQLVGPENRAAGYGLMNFVSISCGGFADWIFGALRDHAVPLNGIFGVFAGIALLSVGIALSIRLLPSISK
ncbi:MAG: MFS transporter [Opitutales bacterium]|nr:MAG: MFS transporter [Opitutales bacterium]